MVATVGSTSITLAQVDDKALRLSAESFGTGMKLFQILYEARQAALDDIIADLLIDQEVKTRGIDRATLIQQEIAAKVPAPTSDAEITDWYQKNPDRVAGREDRAGARRRSGALLIGADGRRVVPSDDYLDQLKSEDARCTLSRSQPPRQIIATAGHHSTKGPEGAPIELVEFADFQCPFCFRAHPTVERVLTTYGDRIHFVYRHYPLSNHPNARPAAEASECAAEQDKFWPYYQALFTASGQARRDAGLKQRPRLKVGLNADRFAMRASMRGNLQG